MIQQMQEIKKARERGQTREGIGAMAVRLLRCNAFTDAPDTSVVLCAQGREVDGRQEVEEEGERRKVQSRKQIVGRVVHTAEKMDCAEKEKINQNRNESNESEKKM